ncbi:MAG: thymidylate kinase [Candidatus Moraniibacteriota bacterium]
MSRKSGKLIVIDGTDGSGKATQTKLLVKRLKKQNGIQVRTLDFPQYTSNFFGRLLDECLHGKQEGFSTLDPHITSVLYAADRFESKRKIEKWIEQGMIVVLDRYVSANQIHQGGKIADIKKREEFLKWLDKMEYEIFGIPRPDVLIYLSIPVEFSVQLLDAEKKESDIVETDRIYLENSAKSAEWLCRRYKWNKISCTRKGALRSIEEIHEEILLKIEAHM